MSVLAESSAGAKWRLRVDDTWCMITPPGYAARRQGWKLHVSATPASAPQVLANAVHVLVEHKCAFKFAATASVLAELNGVRADRAQSGKFLTVYPADDDQLRLLADQLHRATFGLVGPAILSDRRYRPDSLVHYRFGCFAWPTELDDTGYYEGQLCAPDGTLSADVRNPWFSPPEWAVLPFEPPSTNGRKRGDPIVIAGRYRVTQAIRHSNRGGVYRATDERTGEAVLLKEARPHIAADPNGKDVRDRLRHEAEVLEWLGPTGITPALREVVEVAGHVFLVEDLVPGVNLQRWSAVVARRNGRQVPVDAVWQLARSLTRLIGAAHEKGFVLRDFTPSNVMVRPDDVPVLVDMECAVRADQCAFVAGTPGFAAPEYVDGVGALPAPGPEVDCFGLGATLLYVAAGINPMLAADSPAGQRATGARIAAIVEAAESASPALHALAPLIRGLTADLPHRWTLSEAAAFLRAEPVAAQVVPGPVLPADKIDQLADDGLAYLADTMQPRAKYLWPRPLALPPGDPCNVHLGAAGVLAVFDRAVRSGKDWVAPALATTAGWLDDRLTRQSRILPGLYFGRSGTAWALHAAAETLGDTALAERALDYALRIPLDWTNPDISHGLAGAGLAQLRLWHASGDNRFAERTMACADRLVQLTSNAAARVEWLADPRFRDELAGSASYGFGHGVAGNAGFLLAAGRDLQRPDLIDIAIGGGHALCAVAERHGDSVRWPTGPGKTATADVNFWCNGTSGVGTFLVRLWQFTVESRFLELAEGAAHSVYLDRWRLGTGACHGIAGNAELLLDLAAATGQQRYRQWAAEIATCLYVRAAERDGRLLVPDDSMRGVCASYNVGLAGILDFLLRLGHGGERSWQVDNGRLATLDDDERIEVNAYREEADHGH
ncbi:class IV lanthionine synthetase LanL [Nocardia altamirensis]|uniref:class IV lanthionine synthetase LanL n=1 Tax=Nocardia altamirensis TaxID=472158 RepID=UPI00083FDD54|nr:class IV lanthionine synthetase LanL [Nocardia altamirensis]